jgi:glycosyltransferase 2 family protein
MTNKRSLAYAVITAILILLFYLQFRSWKRFDWESFLAQTRHVGRVHILLGIAYIYFAYVLRAVRWQIFLRPVKRTTTVELLSPTIVGFTGLSLLGRPGEIIRPYLIARKVNLSFSSQMAVWTVERIFDFGGFAVLLISAIFLSPALKTLPYYGKFRLAGLVLIVLVAALAAGAVVIHRAGEWVASLAERRFVGHASGLGHKIATRVREFRGGLNTIHGTSEFVQLTAVSVIMWFIIALAYHQVISSYGSVLHIRLPEVFLLMLASMIGSLVQLPGVGGGAQLATISALQHVFGAAPELAASCGILLWIVTFMSVAPVGLVIAHRERLSLRGLSKESQAQELQEESAAKTLG